MRGALARRHPPARSPAPRARTGCCLLVRSPRLDRRRALEKKTADTSCGPRRGAAAERPPGHARGHCLTPSVRRADARIAVEPRRGGKLAGPLRPYTAIPTSQPSLAEQRAWRSLAAAVDRPGRSADAAETSEIEVGCSYRRRSRPPPGKSGCEYATATRLVMPRVGERERAPACALSTMRHAGAVWPERARPRPPIL